MARSLVAPVFQVYNNGALTATGAIGTVATLKLAESYLLTIFCSAVAGSGTLDLCAQTSWDNGTTWTNLPLRSAQVTAAGTTYIRWQPALGFGEAASGGAAALTGGALAANVPHNPAYFRLYGTIGGTSVTCIITIAMISRNDALA